MRKQKKSRKWTSILWLIIFTFVAAFTMYLFTLFGAEGIGEILGERDYWLMNGVIDGLILIGYLFMYRVDAQNTGGKVPFGYKVENKKVYVEESEAEIVKKMFEDYCNGKSIKEIKNWLNNNGICMHNGGMFTFGRVSYMLRNEKYIGRSVIQGEEYFNIYPTILDKDIFATVQERLSKNTGRSNRVRAQKEFLLTGKLYCACCGNLITGDGGTSHTGAKYLYYKCASKKKNTKKCISKSVKKDLIEDSVYDKVIETLKEPGFLERVSQQVTEIYNAGIEMDTELKILRKQLADTDKKINNLMEAVCNGFYNKMSQQKMAELNEIRDKLLVEIAKEEQKEHKKLRMEDVKKFLLHYSKYTDGSMESKKRLIETFVKEVIFDGTNVLIILRTINTAEAIEELKENSLVNPKKAGTTIQFERLYSDTERFLQKNESQTEKRFSLAPFGDLIGNRTRVYAVRGRRLNRLTIRPGLNCLCSISYFSFQGNCFYPSKRNFFLFFGKNIFLSPKRFFR